MTSTEKGTPLAESFTADQTQSKPSTDTTDAVIEAKKAEAKKAQSRSSLMNVAFFHGYPSMFDGSSSVREAAARIGRYDAVMFGNGLFEPSHEDHRDAVRIIQTIAPTTRVYGYVTLGATTDNLSMEAIRRALEGWASMGVYGALFDEAGFDFETERRRQNAAIDAAHACNLRVMVNAWDPNDLFDDSFDPSFNPTCASITLKPGDTYVYESFGCVDGSAEDPAFQSEKIAKLRGAQRRGIRIVGVTTSARPGFFSKRLWRRVQKQALTCGLDGLGWGEFNYAAHDSIMPFRRIQV